MTAMALRPAVSSPGMKPRPNTGCVPRVEKKFQDVWATCARPASRTPPRVDIVLHEQRGIGEVGALASPLVKLRRAVVGRNEFPLGHRAQAAWLVERQRAQQQCVDHAEDTRVGANSDGKRGNGERCVSRTASPKAKRVPDILGHFARNL